MKRSAQIFWMRSLVCLLLSGAFLWKWGCFLEVPNLEGWACVVEKDCISPLVCREKICRKPCFNDFDCLATRKCSNGFCTARLTSDGGSPELFCIPSQAGEICNGKDDDCNGQIDENDVCATEGLSCEIGSNGTQECKGGLHCTALSLYPDRPRICLRSCSLNDPNACPENFRCLQAGANQKSICVQVTCEKDSDCVYKSTGTLRFSCVRVGGSNRLCLPQFSKTGAAKAGARCSPLEDIWCIPGFSCVRKSSQSDGVCTVRCASANDCSRDIPSAKCELLEGNTRVCLSQCGSSSECSPGLDCNAGVCLARK